MILYSNKYSMHMHTCSEYLSYEYRPLGCTEHIVTEQTAAAARVVKDTRYSSSSSFSDSFFILAQLILHN